MKYARALTALVVGSAFVLAATPAFAQGVGNAGTIKIATPSSPTSDENNEPHVPCVFRADYYGFRAGTYNVTITGIAPTGGGQLATDTVTIATSGKGNEYQTSKTYDLTTALAGVTAHPQQGYHIRYDAKRSGSPGQGSKTKVFWVECGTTGSSGGDTVVRDRTIKRLDDDARVLGSRFTSGGVSGLATTASDEQNLAIVAVSLMICGAALQRVARKGKHSRR